MLRAELHERGADGRCEACGEPFPCSIAQGPPGGQDSESRPELASERGKPEHTRMGMLERVIRTVTAAREIAKRNAAASRPSVSTVGEASREPKLGSRRV
jgi:hypothetical protein